MNIRSLFLLSMVLLSLPAVLRAQTISTSPLGKATFCAGETVTVNYTATGTFQPGNTFIVQLSSPTGSFQTGFKNLGSVSSTTSGSITVDLPVETVTGSAYRLRVIASNPRVDGSDNGTDLSIDAKPETFVTFRVNGVNLNVIDLNDSPVTLVDRPVNVWGLPQGDYSYQWNFGAGAVPTLSTQPVEVEVMWTTPGTKTVTLTVTTPNGCQATATQTITVYGHDPEITAGANIVQNHQTHDEIRRGEDLQMPVYWVCPGGILETRNLYDAVVFVEAGGSLIARQTTNALIYVKAGGTLTYTDRGEELICYEPGAGLNPIDRTGTEIEVATLNFDYSNIPPGGCPSLAPYTVQIKPNVNGIHIVEEDDKSDVEYWIWKDASLTSNGNNNIHCVEAGGSLTVKGDNNRIYLKEGAVLNVQGGTGNRIFYETKATIINTGEAAVLLPSSGITFDVSQISSVAVAGDAESALTLSPNPTVGNIEIILSRRGDVIRSVELLDGLGRSLYSAKGEGSRHRIDLSGFPSGVYHAKVETNTGTFIRKIVRE